jgi:hypothetical protein
MGYLPFAIGPSTTLRLCSGQGSEHSYRAQRKPISSLAVRAGSPALRLTTRHAQEESCHHHRSQAHSLCLRFAKEPKHLRQTSVKPEQQSCLMSASEGAHPILLPLPGGVVPSCFSISVRWHAKKGLVSKVCALCHIRYLLANIDWCHELEVDRFTLYLCSD